MTQAEPTLPPIDQLEQAVGVRPPTRESITAARTAIGALAAELPQLDREQFLPLAQRASELCGELALAGVDEEVASEFGTHRDTYGALARLLGGSTEAQTAATSTAGKSGTMTGGKA